ncbi:hypothetical protein GCM10009765_80160 [Fodinicola feengrottensis]|uniref:Insertion element IS402-like domain-containing protein n=1 Tax=Fodinicola feengrottensis TaxID=435914 RepID=A0ABP4V852_9ACTN
MSCKPATTASLRLSSPRAKKHLRRAILDAIFYLVGGGIAWRQLPSDFPPAMTVYSPFHSWAKIGVWQRIHDALRD